VPSDELLTTAELGALIKVPATTLRQWRHRGVGPVGFRIENGRVRYRRSAVELWLADQEHADAARRVAE